METTSLKLILRGEPFTWGIVSKFHKIDNIDIVEFVTPKGDVNFSVYIDGKDTSRSASTLDGALLLGLASRSGASYHMAFAAMRVLGIQEEN